MYEGL